MSTDFTGVTFPKQKITPSDDAIVRRAMLGDCILSGCAMTYSGSTLTMAAGHLLVCGRQIRHPSTQNWAVTEANTGYARLVITVDISRTSTADNFDQVLSTIEYAAAEDGFAALEQTDINVSGVRYQVAACVVSLGSGGITGIVSQLDTVTAGASGAGLNFSLVGGATQPTDRKQNTIWVSTTMKLTGYSFASDAPKEPKVGAVWIRTGESSPAAFSVIRNQSIMLYPIGAAQWDGSGWINRDAYLYNGTEWVQFSYFRLYIIRGGVINTEAIGSLTHYGWTWDKYPVTHAGYTQGDGYITMYADGNAHYLMTENAISFDVWGYANIEYENGSEDTTYPRTFGVSTSLPTSANFSSPPFVSYASMNGGTGRQTKRVALTPTMGYIGIYAYGESTNLPKIYNLWLDPK